jgi:hypothetical protein
MKNKSSEKNSVLDEHEIKFMGKFGELKIPVYHDPYMEKGKMIVSWQNTR